MNWVEKLLEFGKKLILIESDVKSNAEDIKELREDLKKLVQFTNKIARVVEVEKAKRQSQESRIEDRETIFIQRVELELLKLKDELRSNQPRLVNDQNGARPSLPTSNIKR